MESLKVINLTNGILAAIIISLKNIIKVAKRGIYKFTLSSKIEEKNMPLLYSTMKSLKPVISISDGHFY